MFARPTLWRNCRICPTAPLLALALLCSVSISSASVSPASVDSVAVSAQAGSGDSPGDSSLSIAAAFSDITSRYQDFVADEITSRLKFYSGVTVDSSVYVTLNGFPLWPGYHYRIDYLNSVLTFLSPIQDADQTDTLRLRFRAAPPEMRLRFGVIPQTLAEGNTNSTSRIIIRSGGRSGFGPAPGSSYALTPSASGGGNLKISGAKRFSISARQSGASTFDQSLDLTISGELTEGLRVSGHLSDRAYDPAYGASNSRISELDKLRLTFSSSRFSGTVGDLTLSDKRWRGSHSAQRLSGVAVSVDGDKFALAGALGRSRGEREKIRFTGRDGAQGPYRLVGSAGVVRAGRRQVTPGSLEVWLDGQTMREGAANDYTVDYSAGEITFTGRRPIDSRSRIEVDYDPLETAFRKEFQSFSTSVNLFDERISLDFGVRREGDRSNEALAFDLSESARMALSLAGDSSSLATLSGVTASDSGSYELVTDSANPAGFLNYVGAGQGDLAVVFSYMGAGLGQYRYRGAGRYDFVGAGDGEYSPVIALSSPELREVFDGNLKLNSGADLNLSVGGSLSRVDLNLLSSLDDRDNNGALFGASVGFRQEAPFFYTSSSGGLQWKNRARVLTESTPVYSAVQNSGLSGFMTIRIRQPEHRVSDRLSEADFLRDFNAPAGFSRQTRERLLTVGASERAGSKLGFSARYEFLDYAREFSSERFNAGVNFADPTLALAVEASHTRSRLDSSGAAGEISTIRHRGHLRLGPSLTLKETLTYDTRENRYSASPSGTRYTDIGIALIWRGLSVGVSSRRDDTLNAALSADWSELFRRDRLSLTGDLDLGLLTAQPQITWQKVGDPTSAKVQRLLRLHARFFPKQRQTDLQVTYSLSHERRSQRGLIYLPVEAGQGTHILLDSVFLPDDDGDYLELEENLSDTASVRIGLKDIRFNRRWTFGEVRFSSRVEEELLAAGVRGIRWVVPALWSGSAELLFGERSISAEVAFYDSPRRNTLRFSASRRDRTRLIGVLPRQRYNQTLEERYQRNGNLWRVEQTARIFESDVDSYYSASGEVNGWSLGLAGFWNSGPWQIGSGLRFRRASGSGPLDPTRLESTTFSALPELRYQRKAEGSIRFSAELYTQSLSEQARFSPVLFRLSSNNLGELGANLRLSADRNVSAGGRLRLQLEGRFVSERTPRLRARLELVAVL